MLGRQERWREDLFVAAPLRELIPDDHILKRIDRILDLSWLRKEVQACYDSALGRPGIDPEAALRLMLAGCHGQRPTGVGHAVWKGGLYESVSVMRARTADSLPLAGSLTGSGTPREMRVVDQVRSDARQNRHHLHRDAASTQVRNLMDTTREKRWRAEIVNGVTILR